MGGVQEPRVTRWRSVLAVPLACVFGGLPLLVLILVGAGWVYTVVWAVSAVGGVVLMLLLRDGYQRWLRDELTGHPDTSRNSRARRLSSVLGTLGVVVGAATAQAFPAASTLVISGLGGFLAGLIGSLGLAAWSCERSVMRDVLDGTCDGSHLEPTVGVKFAMLPLFHKVLWVVGASAGAVFLAMMLLPLLFPLHR